MVLSLKRTHKYARESGNDDDDEDDDEDLEPNIIPAGTQTAILPEYSWYHLVTAANPSRISVSCAELWKATRLIGAAFIT